MTTFGTLLENYRKEKKLALEVAMRDLKRRNKGKVNTRIEETTITTGNGDIIHSLELWQKIDEEHIKMTGRVDVESLGKSEAKDELKDLLT